MATGISMEKRVDFHGFWCAGDHVSEKLLKSIIADYPNKPSRSCKFHLSTSGLSMELFPTEDGRKGGKLNDIDFRDIKDILYGHQNAPWLLVIYLDPKRTLSIIVCSCQTHEDALSIHKTYMSINYSRQQNWHFRQTQRGAVNGDAAVPNHALRAQIAHRLSVTSAGQGSSYTSYNSNELDNGHALHNSDDILIRQNECSVERGHTDVNSDVHPLARHIGVQTQPTDDDPDTASLVSETSSHNVKDDIQSVSKKMKDIKLSEQTTGISAEEYHRLGDLTPTRNRKTVAFQPTPAVINNHNPVTQVSHTGQQVQEPNSKMQVGPGDYDRRSVSAQTIKSPLQMKTHYTKHPLPSTISSAYKERVAALRKRGGSESGSSITVDGHMSNISNTTNSIGNTGVKQHPSKPLMRSLSSGRTTIVRPIEQVYHHRTGSQKKRTIIIANKPLFM